MDRDIFLAILALDSYNQGYDAKTTVSSNKIGNATIIRDSSGLDDRTAGFYATAYDWNGETVISYRGGDSYSDLIAGWKLAFGLVGQGQLAIEFYRQVVDAATGNGLQTVFDPAPSNLVITGHSLGGGLAGLVAALSGAKAVLFDHSTFGSSVAAQFATEAFNRSQGVDLESISGSLLSALGLRQPNYDNITAFNVEGEYLAYVRNGNVTNALAMIAEEAIAQIIAFYVKSKGVSEQVEMAIGRALASIFKVDDPFGQLGRVVTAGEDKLFKLPPIQHYGSKLNSIQLNEQDLLVLLKYALVKNHVEWQKISDLLLPTLFDANIGKAIGLKQGQGGTGTATEDDQLRTIIAYSAIEEGTKPFGDKAIVGLFDDADEIGKVSAAGNALLSDGTLDKYNKPYDVIPSDLGPVTIYQQVGENIKQALSQIAVQFAGDIAFQKETSAKYATGVFQLDGVSLKAEFKPDEWVRTNAQVNPRILGLTTLVNALHAKLEYDAPQEGGSKFADAVNAEFDVFAARNPDYRNATWLQLATSSAAVTLDASTAVKAKSGREGGAILIGGDGKDTITGAKGDDLILGGAGDDTITSSKGHDLVFGGDGNDTLTVTLDSAVGDNSITFFGGAGVFDKIDYSALKTGVTLTADARIGTAEIKSQKDHAVYTATFNALGRTDVLIDVEKIIGTAESDKLYIKDLTNVGSEVIDLGKGQDHVDLSLSNHGYIVDLSHLGAQTVQAKQRGGSRFNPSPGGGSGPILHLRNANDAIGDSGDDKIIAPEGDVTADTVAAGADPLVLDLDGDGIEVTTLNTSSSPLFDITGNGVKRRTAWVFAHDGLLAIDKNNNGSIDGLSELFGQVDGSGFDDLAALDNNNDGVITAADSAFASLRVWVDANGDAITDAGELKTLSELGIASISLTSRAPTQNESTINGNDVTAIGTYTKTDGTVREIADVSLAYVNTGGGGGGSGGGSGGGGGGSGGSGGGGSGGSGSGNNSTITASADGGGGDDEIYAFGGTRKLTAGGLGRDYIQNTSLGGELWGDIANSDIEVETDRRFYTETDANGKQTKKYIEDTKENGDNFWWAPNTTIFDAQKHDNRPFFSHSNLGLHRIERILNSGQAAQSLSRTSMRNF